MIQITATISLRDDEIEEQFLRSPGPGGQKVDKTETAVQLRFNAGESPAISLEVLLRLEKLAGRRMTGDGVIIITASRHDRGHISVLRKIHIALQIILRH